MSDVLQAVYRGDREEAELLAAGRDLDVFEASALGRTERVRELLDADPSLVDAYGDDGFHPVGLASFFGHVDTARLLFERGADANQLARNEHIQTAAIHAAAAAEAKDEDTRYELVKLALEHGADPDLEQGGGFRAIDAARQNGDTRVEQLLREHGASTYPSYPEAEVDRRRQGPDQHRNQERRQAETVEVRRPAGARLADQPAVFVERRTAALAPYERQQEPQGQAQSAGDYQRPEQLVSRAPNVRDPKQNHAGELTHERDHDAADRQEHDRADPDPVSPLGPTHAEPLARLSGDVGRISHAVEDVPNPDLVVRAELRSQLPDVRGDLVDHLAPRSCRKRGKLTLEVLQVAPDQIVRRSAHRPASPPTKWSTASRNLLHS